MSDRWAVFGLAWPVERVQRMDASLAVVRDWLRADGVSGVGMGGEERAAVRQRAIAAGLSPREAWLVHGVLVADARRLMPPGGRVQERAKRAVLAAQEALEARNDPETPVRALAGAVARPGLSEARQYAVAEHAWQAEDPVPVVEDLPWSLEQTRATLGAIPVGWWGLTADPATVGIDGDRWREVSWRVGWPRPAWAEDSSARKRVLLGLRPFGWDGAPLRADLDDIERYLPVKRPARGIHEHVAWLVPGVRDVGWAVAWRLGM